MSHSIDDRAVSMTNAQLREKSGTRNVGGVFVFYEQAIRPGVLRLKKRRSKGDIPSIPKTISTTRPYLNQVGDEEKRRKETPPSRQTLTYISPSLAESFA